MYFQKVPYNKYSVKHLGFGEMGSSEHAIYFKHVKDKPVTKPIYY
jgi:hypothetical protein